MTDSVTYIEVSKFVFESGTGILVGTSRETVIVGSDDGTLYEVDASTGTQEWAFTQPYSYVESSPTVVGGTVYAGSFDGNVYAMDAATGTHGDTDFVYATGEPVLSVGDPTISPTVNTIGLSA